MVLITVILKNGIKEVVFIYPGITGLESSVCYSLDKMFKDKWQSWERF